MANPGNPFASGRVGAGGGASSGGAGRLSGDARSLDALRHGAAKDPKAAAQEAARAFESLFMNELLKSMRAATESAGLMDNAVTQLGTELLDAQLASNTATTRSAAHRGRPAAGLLMGRASSERRISTP